MEIFLHTETWLALLTLTLLEIILGVDNIIFISIVSNKLPTEQRNKARMVGLILALGFRIALLFAISLIINTFTKPLFHTFDPGNDPLLAERYAISVSDIIFILGGLFLVAKSTTEINHKMDGAIGEKKGKGKVSISTVIAQIILMDIIFSFDSILTAVGLSNEIIVMVIAVVISLVIMIVFSGKIADFIGKHPSLEMLALSFLILIGFMLMLEGLEVHVDKQFIYFALFFSLGVEFLNMRLRRKSKPVKLHRFGEEAEGN
ncbi:MAG: TerC family protein [Chitinophagales bacterium]|nr:TerC family protein [Chitinophagales bacterium]